MDNIVLNFTSDVSGLEPAEAGLTNLTEQEKKLADQAKKAATEMDNGNKKIASSIDKLTQASKGLDKSIVGGAYKQYLQTIQKELGLTQKELVSYVQNARKAAQAKIIEGGTTEEIKELQLSIEIMNDQLKELGVDMDETGQKTQSLRARLREAKEELVAMAEAGMQGTPEFEAMRKKAGELDDQMRDLNATIKGTGSDTKNIDGLISLASGVAGGFAVAQGAAALFGSENEEIQKALLKVNAAMSILQGLQAIQNVMQKESAASLLLNTSARSAQATATVAQTVAEGANVVATEAATVAQVELNTAMSLNPVGILIAGILAAVAAFQIFSEEGETAAEKMERMTTEAEDLYTSLQKISKVSQFAIDREIDISQNKALVDQLTAQEASISDINAAKKEGLKLSTESLQQELLNIQAAKERSGDVTQFLERELNVKRQIYENSKAQLLLDIETNKVLVQRALKSNAGEADAEVARKKLAIVQNQVDSIASIEAVTNAEINAIKKRQAEQLNNAELTQGEINKIRAEGNLKIAELEKAQQGKLLDIQKSGINAQLSAVLKGSEKEFELRKDLLAKDQEIELAATELTQEQVLEIKSKYKEKEIELTRQFEEQKIQNEISYLTSYLDVFGIGEDQKLELTIRRLDQQRDLEISQAEMNAAKIAEINAKYDKQILESRKAAIEAQLAANLRTLDVFGAKYKAQQERILAGNGGADQKNNAIDALLKRELDRLELQEAANKKLLDNKIIDETEYNLRHQDILNQQEEAEYQSSQKKIAIAKDEQEKKQALINATLAIVQKSLDSTLETGAAKTAMTELLGLYQKIQDINNSNLSDSEKLAAQITSAITAAQVIINQVFADASARRQADLQAEIDQLEKAKQAELDNKNLTEQQKADIAQKYANKEKQLKRQAFIADKQAKKEQAVINGLLAVTNAVATAPNIIAGIVLAALVAASTAIQVAQIQATPIPQFKHGKKKGQYEGPGWVDDGGRNEPIMRADGTIEMSQGSPKPRLTYLAKDDIVFPSMNHMMKEFKFPQIPESVEAAVMSPGIDYEMLSSAIAKKMAGIIPAPAHVHNNIDEHGLRSFIIAGNNRTEIKNKRYSFE